MTEVTRLTQNGLIDEIRARLTSKLTKSEVREVLDATTAAIADQLQQGTQVSLRGFGKFAAPMHDAFTARNPKTGEPVEVPAKRRVRFTASPSLLNPKTGEPVEVPAKRRRRDRDDTALLNQFNQ